MYYIGWMIINIDLILAFLILLGIILVFKNKKMGKWMVLISFFFFFIIGNTNIAHIPARILEDSTEPQSKLEETSFEGIILLGGNFSLQFSTENHPVFNLAASRLFEGIQLAQMYPNKKIIFTGTKLEAVLTKKYFEKFGINPDRIIIDDKARSTKDNAKHVKELLKEDSKKPWLLVTSAFHMKRSLQLFKQVGVNVIPHPVDYHIRHTGNYDDDNYQFKFAKDGFMFWYAMVKEVLGLLEIKDCCKIRRMSFLRRQESKNVNPNT